MYTSQMLRADFTRTSTIWTSSNNWMTRCPTNVSGTKQMYVNTERQRKLLQTICSSVIYAKKYVIIIFATVSHTSGMRQPVFLDALMNSPSMFTAFLLLKKTLTTINTHNKRFFKSMLITNYDSFGPNRIFFNSKWHIKLSCVLCLYMHFIIQLNFMKNVVNVYMNNPIF